jgi:DSF synthase
MAAPAQLIDLAAQRQSGAAASPASAPNGVAAVVAAQRLQQFRLNYDADEKVLWCQFEYTGRPCFSPQVLNEAQQVQRLVRDLSLAATGASEEPPLRYLVLASRLPGIWNLGGDLELFANLIRRRDRAELTRYAQLCCEVGYVNASLYQLPVISIALVQGDALGGGFEAAMSSNLVIAERGAKFGLPEVLFNLFPGMGAYTFMARRIAPGLAERMILSGEIFTAEKLHEIGLIDVLAPDGAGVEALYEAIGRGGKRHNTHVALRAARRLVNPVAFEEMSRIAELWVDAAFKLDDGDLKRMLRLAAAQDRRRERMIQPT